MAAIIMVKVLISEEGRFRCPLWGQTAVLRNRGESGGDLVDPATQRSPDTSSSTSTECRKHCGDDANGDDHVLERHHAVPVRAQTLQRFGGLNIIPQHRRKSFFSR